MLSAIFPPSPDGRGASFFNHEQRARLWSQETNAGPAKRASALISQMDVVARQVCMAAGSDVIMDGDCAGKMLGISRENSAPGSGDSVYTEVIRFFFAISGHI